jgi:hypothetical protein
MKKASICANSYAIPGRYPIKELRARAKRKAKEKAKALRAGFCITADDASRAQL